MKKKHDKIKVLYATTEVAPFSKVGGLADVSGALPKALLENDIAVKVITPLYKSIKKATLSKVALPKGTSYSVLLGDTSYKITLHRGTLPKSRVEVIFVENEELLSRPGVYGDESTPNGYPDNHLRFILFAKAILKFCELSSFKPDILHLNDYQTALAAPMLKHSSTAHPMKTIVTIHNIGYQGVHPKEDVQIAGLNPADFYAGGPLEFYGQLNFLKAGIESCDKISTVSPTYAREITQSPEFGFGLEGVLKRRQCDLVGILNGIDDTEWNPRLDPLIPFTFSEKNLNGKLKDKKALIAKLNLEDHLISRPIIGMITRLVDQKGLDLVMSIFEPLMALDVGFVLLGTGLPKYHDFFKEMAQTYRKQISITLGFDNALAHLIEAASDMFLMPSRYEPCGLNQIYSLQYGTVPIVRATGGLADVVTDYSASPKTGVGFCFHEYSSAALLEACQRAVTLYTKEPKAWASLVKRGIMKDYSWNKSAAEYVSLYKKVLGG